MRKYLFRILVTLGLIVLSVVMLWPTWADYQYQQALDGLTGRTKDSTKYYDENGESIRNARANRLKLGLDLQGGMYVTMEVDILSMLDKMARNKDDQFRQIFAQTKSEAGMSDAAVVDLFRANFDKRNVRMSRYYGDLRDDNATIAASLQEESEKAVDRAIQIIRNRVDQYGVAEITITKQGSRRIVLELPGVSNEKEVRGLIQETALLEFKLFAPVPLVQKTFENIDKVLAGKQLDSLTASADSAQSDSAQAVAQKEKEKKDSAEYAGLSKEQQAEKFKREHPFSSLFIPVQFGSGLLATPELKEQITNILKREDVKRMIPPDLSIAWAARAENIQGKEYYMFYALKGQAELTGEVVVDAKARMDSQGMGGAVVSMEMSADGASEWARITGENVNKPIAIVLDDAVFSAPNVKQKIIGGSSQIDGMKDMNEARLLEIVLKAGALPAPVEIIEERTVGPSLGEDSINKGWWSFVIGVGLVFLMMVMFYHTAGIGANIAVIFNMLFILGILAGFKATLTLPGIAGMLLTVGMAVDANVLINERIREEYGMGKTLRAALDAGYSRAMPAIIDSNLTTIITSVILYNFGSGPIQGFALTLIIGLLSSMFTAIVMTRIMFELTLDKSPKLLNFG